MVSHSHSPVQFIHLFHLPSQSDHFPFLFSLKLFISMYLTLFVHNKYMRATVSCKICENYTWSSFCTVWYLDSCWVNHMCLVWISMQALLWISKGTTLWGTRAVTVIVLWIAKLWFASVWVRQDCCIPELLGYHFEISQKCWFIGFFIKMPKATISFVMSICMEKYGSCWLNCHELSYWGVFLKSIKKIQVWLW